MARYIDADLIKQKLQERSINPTTTFINTVLLGLIDNAPTAPVAPIADTVKKMQERWHSTMCDIPTKYCARTDCSLSYRIGDWVDDIAKEMLEGGDTE